MGEGTAPQDRWLAGWLAGWYGADVGWLATLLACLPACWDGRELMVPFNK